MAAKKKKSRPRPVVEEVATTETETATKSIESPPAEIENPSESEPKPKPEKEEQEVEIEPKKTNFKLILIITLITALIVGFVSGGVYVYFTGARFKKADSTPSETATPIPTTTSTPTPSPTPEPKDLSEYKVSVLNGSGIIGAAGTVGDLLEEAGFTISNKANASKFDYESTIIQTTEDIPSSVTKTIKDTLEDADYTVETGDDLDEDSDYNIIITVGSS